MSDQIEYDDDAKRAIVPDGRSLFDYLCWAIVSCAKYPPWEGYERYYRARRWDEDL